MKHLIIFLNYCRSRLDNPVYRQFSKEAIDRRDTTLLFLPRPLEERELMHEVADLRRKEMGTLSDVTFHICANFERTDEGECLAQTARLIRRMFPSDTEHQYHCLAYALLPELKTCNEKEIKTIWNNLATTNNASTEYTDFQLINRIYLYHDLSQQSLAEFLHESIHSKLDISGTDEYGKSESPEQFAPIFATFNTTGITYPEESVRDYLRKEYIATLLKYSKPEANPTSIETCNEEAKHILSFVPIQNSRICLQEETFLNSEIDLNSNWKPVEKFWKDTADGQSQGMNDIPHSDWLDKIRQRIEVFYQSRFREVGVEYFFQLQAKKTDSYVQILQSIINQEFIRTVLSNPYSPETQKIILRSIVNILQQKVLELQNLEEETEKAILSTEKQIAETSAKWTGMNFLSRMMKKDDSILDEYTQEMAILYNLKTQVPGCRFAVKLLNELIPAIQEIQDKIDVSRKVLDEAISMAETSVHEANPSQVLGHFSQKQVEMAVTELPKDPDHFLGRYQQLVQFFFSNTPAVDCEDLIARIYTHFGEKIDQYLKDRIDAGTLPPVMNQVITERMRALYADRGGLQGFINLLKEHTQLKLALKDNNNADYYVLVSPVYTEDNEVKHIITDDLSHIQMLHLQQDVRLTDLDGFSGQRMFIEPTIF